MANLIPSGVNTTSGRDANLAAADNLVTTADSGGSNTITLSATGAVGIAGLQGATGLQSGTQGTTGIELQGATGLQGLTGVISLPGLTGLVGETGIQGFTGVTSQGTTGLRGVSGLAGINRGHTGTAGLTGFIGLRGLTGVGLGETGITGETGVEVSGVTGLQGATGVLIGDTGLLGVTGIAQQGVTGIQGLTGLQGVTGLFGYQPLDIQRQTSGVTGFYTVTANTLATNENQIEFWAWGSTANGVSTTITVSFGELAIFSDDTTIAGGTTFQLRGSILRVSSSIQEVTIWVTYNESAGCNVSRFPTTSDLTAANNVIVSVASAGTGHVLNGLVVIRAS